MRRIITLALSAFVLVFGIAACSSGSGAASDSALQVSEETIILDVRTPEEYAAGHLEGATLLDFNGGEVAAAIPNLDPEAEYVVYCRSGNRSSQATAMMEQAGFTNVVNLGSLEQASSATGVPVVL